MTQLAIGLVARLISFFLYAFACRSIGSAFTYFPLMIDATRAGVAIEFLNKSADLAVFTIVPSLSLDA